MKVFNNEMVAAFDVDDTLVLWDKTSEFAGEGKVEFLDPDDNSKHYLYPHVSHIRLLKCSKKRGFLVLVWSAAGYKWAETVIKTLKLEEYVDIILTKCSKYFDDLQPDEILGQRVYLNYEPELWKDVIDYEGLYQVSNLGRVKSLQTSNKKELIKSLHTAHSGYVCVTLNKKSKSETTYVHRLVAKAFHPNPDNKKVVNHIDSNKANNNASNLEWVTYSENLKHSFKAGRKILKGTERFSKVTEEQVLDIRKRFADGGITKTELAKEYKVHPQTIHHIIIRKKWKHI